MRKLLLGFLLFATSCASLTASAAPRVHNIELILFRQTQVAPVYSSRLAPDRLLAEIQPLTPEQTRISLLSNITSKLIPENGYEILLHQAWQQTHSPRFVSYALTSGEESFGHHPVEGFIKIRQDRANEVELNFWINQFKADGNLERSEQLQRSVVLPYKELNFIDYGNLGALIRIMPQ